MRGSKIGQASMLKSIFYVEVCYSISSIVDHVKKPNRKLLRYCIIDINKCYTPGMFLVYRHTSVFLLDCIWAFLFSWMGFPLSLPEWTVFFFFIYIHYRITTLYCHSFQDLSPFISHHEHWCRRMFLFIRMLLLTYSSIMDALLLLIVEVCHAMFAMIFFFSKVCPVRVLRLELQCFFVFF